MCGRYVQTMPADAMRELFRTAGALPNLAPSWNVAPTQSAPVVRRHPETGERHLDPLRWGLRPRWAKAEKGAREPINARAGTVATNGMFRQAYAKRHCLVPAVAFYEWKALDGGKQPMAIATASGEAMASPASGRTGGGKATRSSAPSPSSPPRPTRRCAPSTTGYR